MAGSIVLRRILRASEQPLKLALLPLYGFKSRSGSGRTLESLHEGEFCTLLTMSWKCSCCGNSRLRGDNLTPDVGKGSLTGVFGYLEKPLFPCEHLRSTMQSEFSSCNDSPKWRQCGVFGQ
jgi:hypothetical protein